MNDRKISCIYYPTTVLLVDDHSDFLQHMQLKIGDYFSCLLYSNPKEALKRIKKESKRKNTLNKVIGIDDQSEYYSHQSSKQLPVQYDITSLYKQIYNKNRFSEISVLVVDYQMPDMTGEQLCVELKGSPIKIIMLTAEADQEMAVKLFNAGLIDKFILKGQPYLEETLRKSITEMQQRYFQDLTAPILKGLATNESSSLADPAFIDLFNKILNDVSASDYYLIDLSGSFLFLDNTGYTTWLIIKTREECEEISAQLVELSPSLPWAEAMSHGEKIPYFSNFSDYFNVNKTSYKDHWYDAQLLKGSKDYFYSISKDLKGFSLDQKK